MKVANNIFICSFLASGVISQNMVRKLKNDAQMLADYKKTCESLQREGNIQPILTT